MQEHGLRENEGSLCDSETKNSAHCRHYCHCYPRYPRLSAAAAGKGGGRSVIDLELVQSGSNWRTSKMHIQVAEIPLWHVKKNSCQGETPPAAPVGSGLLDSQAHRIKSIKKWLWDSGCFNVSVFKSCRSILSAGKASWSESSPKLGSMGPWIDVLLLYPVPPLAPINAFKISPFSLSDRHAILENTIKSINKKLPNFLAASRSSNRTTG